MVNEAVLGKVKKNVMEISMSGLTPPPKKKKNYGPWLGFFNQFGKFRGQNENFSKCSQKMV